MDNNHFILIIVDYDYNDYYIIDFDERVCPEW